MRKIFLLFCALFLSCSSPKQADKEAPDAIIRGKYLEAIARLKRNHLENGWVVSRTIEGEPEHQGEGLLWSGLWLAAAPCGEASETSLVLRDMVMRHKGGLVRIEPLGEYEGGREVTLDGALGLYRGIAEEVMRCGNKGDWYEPTLAHLNYVVQHSNKFNEKSKAELIREFTYILDLLAYRLSIRGEPSTDRLRILEAQITSWAAAVVTAKAPAYRIHLGFIALETVETLGKKVNWSSFCLATNGVDIPLIDNKCGRGDLKAWIDAFQYNDFEYRWQRSGKWEKPDGNGLETPGLDYITAMGVAYDL
jgi:hypothetical protein